MYSETQPSIVRKYQTTMKGIFAPFLVLAGGSISSGAAQFASDDACDPALTSPVAYGCTATSDELSVDYPALGEMESAALP